MSRELPEVLEPRGESRGRPHESSLFAGPKDVLDQEGGLSVVLFVPRGESRAEIGVEEEPALEVALEGVEGTRSRGFSGLVVEGVRVEPGLILSGQASVAAKVEPRWVVARAGVLTLPSICVAGQAEGRRRALADGSRQDSVSESCPSRRFSFGPGNVESGGLSASVGLTRRPRRRSSASAIAGYSGRVLLARFTV